MPKSRNRSRAGARAAQQPVRRRKWTRWLGLLLPAALLIGTLYGIFGAPASAAVK